MTTYEVKYGETILDVSVNSTGSPLNIQKILDANGIDSWTPELKAGTTLVIPDNVTLQSNNLRELTLYPVADSGFIPAEDFDILTRNLEILLSTTMFIITYNNTVITYNNTAIGYERNDI